MSSKKSKVFLSLDDLHKLYGIAPDLIMKRKKKKSKKAKKKAAKKSNFGNGVNKQFGSGGGAGFGGVGIQSSTIDRREIDILRGQLNQARNNPNKEENKGVLQLENVPEELKETLKFAKVANDAFSSGQAKISKSPAGNLIMGPTSQKQKQAKRRRAIDLSETIDHTINDAPPIESANDMVYTHPLAWHEAKVEELSDDGQHTDLDVDDVFIPPLEPTTSLAQPKTKQVRTKKQKEQTKAMIQAKQDTKLAKNHHNKQLMRKSFDAIRGEANIGVTLESPSPSPQRKSKKKQFENMTDEELIQHGKDTETGFI